MNDVAWWTAIACLILAAIPALTFSINRAYYRPPLQRVDDRSLPAVSVLIPARNEEAAIGDAVRATLASAGVELEVVVLDDHSDDQTAAIVADLAARDPRVRLERGVALPAGWCGKQHACAQLAGHAQHDVLVFIDADVRLEPTGLARAVGFLEASGAGLVSGVPRQVTVTWLEQLVIPLIQFLLLGFLPMWRMRTSPKPEYGAGCGQLFLAKRSAYEQMGGHAMIRTSLHDGITLPRAFRRAGIMTDLFDATSIAACRMYHSAGQVWSGLAKNAGEGLANPRLIVPASVLLCGGQVLPAPALLIALCGGISATTIPYFALATLLSYYPRLAAAIRFRQSWMGAICHPLGVFMLLLIQWSSLISTLRGRPSEWKGRRYAAATAAGK